MKLYHVSTVPDLKILEPHISTHGKSYVYATSSPEFALFFGGIESAGDFDGIYGIKDNIPYFYEAYEGALKRRFNGAVCYIYEVDPTNFMEGKTSFKGEVVSEKPVKILNSKKIDNIYEHLLELNKESKINLYFYKNTNEYNKKIDEHIIDRITRFNILADKDSGLYKFCKRHFPTIVNKLESENLKK